MEEVKFKLKPSHAIWVNALLNGKKGERFVDKYDEKVFLESFTHGHNADSFYDSNGKTNI